MIADFYLYLYGLVSWWLAIALAIDGTMALVDRLSDKVSLPKRFHVYFWIFVAFIAGFEAWREEHARFMALTSSAQPTIAIRKELDSFFVTNESPIEATTIIIQAVRYTYDPEKDKVGSSGLASEERWTLQSLPPLALAKFPFPVPRLIAIGKPPERNCLELRVFYGSQATGSRRFGTRAFYFLNSKEEWVPELYACNSHSELEDVCRTFLDAIDRYYRNPKQMPGGLLVPDMKEFWIPNDLPHPFEPDVTPAQTF